MTYVKAQEKISSSIVAQIYDGFAKLDYSLTPTSSSYNRSCSLSVRDSHQTGLILKRIYQHSMGPPVLEAVEMVLYYPQLSQRSCTFGKILQLA